MADQLGVLHPAHPSWTPVDLTEVLAGDFKAQQPSVGHREDGMGVLYAGKTHSVASEPEAGKTWFALTLAGQEIVAGRSVVFIDYEDDAEGVVGRLRQRGLPVEQIQDKFIYVRPEVALGPVDRDCLHGLVRDMQPTLVIIDGVTEAMTMEGFAVHDNQDVASFLESVATPLARLSPAVLLLDHEVKKAQDRGRFALGAGHKLAAVTGVAYKLRRGEPFAVGKTGYSEVRIAKDRPGQVRRRALDTKPEQLFAVLTVESGGSDFVNTSITTKVPVRRSRDELQHMKQAIIREMAGQDYPTKGAMKDLVAGNSQRKSNALNQLIEEGRITSQKPYKLVAQQLAS